MSIVIVVAGKGSTLAIPSHSPVTSAELSGCGLDTSFAAPVRLTTIKRKA